MTGQYLEEAVNLKRRYFVYHICDAITHDVRYVGRSCVPEKRFRQHLAGNVSELSRWMNTESTADRMPVLKVVGSHTSPISAAGIENRWIARISKTDKADLLFNRYFRLTRKERTLALRLLRNAPSDPRLQRLTARGDKIVNRWTGEERKAWEKILQQYRLGKNAGLERRTLNDPKR